MTTQSTLASQNNRFHDAIARLSSLKGTDIRHNQLFDDQTTNNLAAICVQNLESLQAEANKRLNVLLMIRSSDNLHWIARSFIGAISNEQHKISALIERLLALFDEHCVAELCEDPALQKKAFARIKQLNDLVESTLRLEQQFAPALQDMSQNELAQTHPDLYQNAALSTQISILH